MDPKKFLSTLTAATVELKRNGVEYSFVGGIAANTYRSSMRLTADIAIFPSIYSEKFGREVIYGLAICQYDDS